MLTFRTTSADETRRLGAAVARALEGTGADNALVVALNGELGAGKTTLVNGLLTHFGVKGPIKSPTYTLIEPYDLQGRLLFHIDLYRLNDASELEMLAPRDLLEPGAILLVEWAERAGNALPNADLAITLRYVNGLEGELEAANLRVIEIHPLTSAGQTLEASLQGKSDKATVSS